VPNHTRLFRRGATYYHRAAIPTDIKDTYPKMEETFSLGTKDLTEARLLVRIKAVEVDERFEAHRREIRLEQHPDRRPMLDELTGVQLKDIADIYYAHRLGGDEDLRLVGFGPDRQTVIVQDTDNFDELIKARGFQNPSFDGYGRDIEFLVAGDRHNNARGYPDEFYLDEANLSYRR